eukprot:2278036-Pleurochrysis_carterae.AAC.1
MRMLRRLRQRVYDSTTSGPVPAAARRGSTISYPRVSSKSKREAVRGARKTEASVAAAPIME